MGVRRACIGGALSLSCFAALSAQTHQAATYLTHSRAVPAFTAVGALPPSPEEWARWIASSDAATRARVAQGDETAIVNLLFFGTSFTNEPRITSQQLDPAQIEAAMMGRLRDFERALSQPALNERLQFARRLLNDGSPVRPRLLSMIERTVREGETFARLSKQAQLLGDPSLEFAERSRLYRDRGLASDSSIRINFAVEDALRRIQTAGGPAGRFRRVAVVGPGLDVVDKQEGYDFYPPQTIQPFALIDSLLRLGLATGDDLEVTTFDVSDRVNGHIEETRRRAGAGSPYVLHVALDGAVAWTPEMLDYFGKFGETAGDPVPVSLPPGVGPLRQRAVAVRPQIVERVTARNLNITAQELALEDAARFDLVVATNVFVYYDRLQQGLAMVSVAGMLRPGGLLLSNNALVEVPSAGMRSIGYSKTMYSDRDEDGDVIVWYQKP